MEKLLSSQAVLGVLGILAVYFALKLIALTAARWTPRNRALTLDEDRLKKWRRTAVLESAGMVCFWLGLLLGIVLSPYVFVLAAAGAILYAFAKVHMVKHFPYIDPATVKKGKRKKKK